MVVFRRTPSLVLAFAASVACCFPAHASPDWWMIQGWGERPSRVLIFADANSVREQESSTEANEFIQVRKVAAEVIYEAAASPDSLKYVFDVHCAQGALREAVVVTIPRDGASESSRPDHAWSQRFMKPESHAWQSRVVDFTCNEAARTKENGMFHFGVHEPYAGEIAWKLWADGTRPDVQPSRSIEQMRAENEVVGREARATNTAMQSQVHSMISTEIEVESRRAARMAKWPKRGLDRAMHIDLLEPYIGFSENDLIARWGVPQHVVERSDSRFLHFEFGYDLVKHSNRGVLGHGESARAQYRCFLTYEVKNGKAIDYLVSGNYCHEALGGPG